jgi:signal recognition particle subunit SRP68
VIRAPRRAQSSLTRPGPAVLEIIKAAQAQNGLRMNDYDRYREYCARRLRRLRTAKTIRFTQGKKKYQKHELTPEKVTDARFLLMPLMMAERAWAMAQGIKAADAGESSGSRRAHALQRLRKAVAHAGELQALTAARGDGRTALEAEAYAAWLQGTYQLETEAWEAALAAFVTARSIYEQLAAVAARRTRDLYLARVDEIAPNERFCRYNLMRRQGKSAASASAAAAASGADSGAALQSKIAAALADSTRGKAGGGTGADGGESGQLAQDTPARTCREAACGADARAG